MSGPTYLQSSDPFLRRGQKCQVEKGKHKGQNFSGKLTLYVEIIALESLEHLSYSLFMKVLKEENSYSTFWKIQNG
jgi:hypothetical protein